MTAEQKLNIALRFLKEKNTSGTYLYYRKDQETKAKKEDLLFFKLEEKKIMETEWFPIIFHLINDGYVDDFYQNENERINKLQPHQIKITFSGIMFIENGGFVKKKKKETISKNLQLAQTWAIAIGSVFAGLWAFYLLLKEIINWCNYNSIHIYWF